MQTAPPLGPVHDEFDQEQPESEEDDLEAQEVPAAGRLLVPGRPVTAADVAAIRGSLEAGINRVVQQHGATVPGRSALFGMGLAQAAQAKNAMKAKLARLATTDEVDAAVAEYVQDLHGGLMELGIIVVSFHPAVEEYVDFYHLCLTSTKDYMNARPSLRFLVAT